MIAKTEIEKREWFYRQIQAAVDRLAYKTVGVVGWLQRCRYVGCTNEHFVDLDAPLSSTEEAEKNFEVGGKDPLDEQFTHFGIYECEGRVYCTDDHTCPWHPDAEVGQHPMLFDGCLCREHLEKFRGQNYGDYYRNIANTDPELFDRTLEDVRYVKD